MEQEDRLENFLRHISAIFNHLQISKLIHSICRLLIGTIMPKEAIFMQEQKRILELTDFEWRLLVGCLNTARSAYLDEGKPIEDVNVLLTKTMNAKLKKARI